MPISTKSHFGFSGGTATVFVAYRPGYKFEQFLSGFVEQIKQTGVTASYYDDNAEQRFLSEVEMLTVGRNFEPIPMRLFVAALPDALEVALAGLKDLPDEGYDLSMIQPQFDCFLERPRFSGDTEHFAKLGFARCFARPDCA